MFLCGFLGEPDHRNCVHRDRHFNVIFLEEIITQKRYVRFIVLSVVLSVDHLGSDVILSYTEAVEVQNESLVFPKPRFRKRDKMIFYGKKYLRKVSLKERNEYFHITYIAMWPMISYIAFGLKYLLVSITYMVEVPVN